MPKLLGENAVSQFKAMLYQKTVHSTSEVKAAFMTIHSMPHLFTSEVTRQEFGQIGHNFELTSRNQCKNSWGRKQVEAWLDLQIGGVDSNVMQSHPEHEPPVFRQEYMQEPYTTQYDPPQVSKAPIMLPKDVVDELREMRDRLNRLIILYGGL